MPFTRLLATCLLAGAVLAGRSASAQTVLRLRLGPAYLSTTLSKVPDLSAQRYSGAGVAFAAELGRPLTSTVTLCAELAGALVPDANAVDSGTLETGTAAADLATAGIGASFTYTNPSNFYVAANPALMTLLTDYLGRDGSYLDLGVEIGFVVGYEWHVSSGWRLGLAGEARYAAMGGAQDISLMSQYALLFSATRD
jgi:hypothetical protein